MRWDGDQDNAREESGVEGMCDRVSTRSLDYPILIKCHPALHARFTIHSLAERSTYTHEHNSCTHRAHKGPNLRTFTTHTPNENGQQTRVGSDDRTLVEMFGMLMPNRLIFFNTQPNLAHVQGWTNTKNYYKNLSNLFLSVKAVSEICMV